MKKSCLPNQVTGLVKLRRIRMPERFPAMRALFFLGHRAKKDTFRHNQENSPKLSRTFCEVHPGRPDGGGA